MSLAAHRTEAAASRGTALALDRVGKSFGSVTVLDDVSLQVPAGQFLAIVGRSGSGKSSLLRMICGLDGPTAGRILFDRVPAGDDVARIMFQEPRLLPWATVLDNVMVGLKPGPSAESRRTQARLALRAVGLEGRAQEWPTVLSGGQKQRIALASALVSRPRLLLLDEPLGALDALTRLDMQALIAKSWADDGFTAVLVTHDVSEAVRLADRIIVIEGGGLTLDIPNLSQHPRSTTSTASVELEDIILRRLMRAS